MCTWSAVYRDKPLRVVEVKAMRTDLANRPVTLTRQQVEMALQWRDKFWLYIVERAGEGSSARIIRICDPLGKAKSFAFDAGWLCAAELAA